MKLNLRISYIIYKMMEKDEENSTPTSNISDMNNQKAQQTSLQNQPQISMASIKPISEINQHNEQNKNKWSCIAKFVTFLCLVFLLIANLYVYATLIQNKIERNDDTVGQNQILSELNITNSHIQQIKQINRINNSINSNNKTSVAKVTRMEKVTRINTKIPSLKQRIQLGSPNVQQVKLIAWTINKINAECTNSCGVINGQLLMNQQSLRSIQNLLDTAIDKAVIFTKIDSIQQIAELANKLNKKYSMTVPNTYQNIDSTYSFITHHFSDQKNGCYCDKVIYFSSSLIFRNSTSRRIRELCDNLAESQFAVLNTYVPLRNKYELDEYMNNEQSSDLYLNNNIASLPPINSMSLQDIYPQMYTKYVYIFDSTYLNHISPLNFAYYVKYSLEQILILPILAILQKTNKLKQIQNITYGMPSSFRYAHQPIYKLHEPKSMKSNKNSKALCFVSYTSTPSLVNFQQISTYLDSINNLDKDNLQLFVILYIPYQYSTLTSSNNISLLYAKIRNMNTANLHIKLRIRANKTLSAHAVYQSTYSYCPYQSLMISSRHNVRFVQSFGQELSGNMNEKFHSYHTNYLQLQKKQENILANVPTYANRYEVRKGNLFRQHFRHIQIFTNKLMRTTTFWVLKNGQLDFYQTQAVFFILMMETIRLQISYINKTLYHVTSRVYTNTQQQQIEILKKYVQYSAVGNRLITYTFNCLENKAYRRFAPDLLPKIIHQIWFGQDKISEVRMHLHRTIKQINPSFQIYLWRTSNITRDNFPLTYSAVHKTLQYHKSYPKSLMALASDLLRYEAVYLYGGVYVDFKMEALRPIDPFLKYQSFFLDAGNGPERFGECLAVGVGVFGATQNNYHLKLLLNEILEMDNINFASKRISQLTGGFVVRKAYKTEQFFTVMGLGYHLFYPRPYDNPVNECGGVDKTFTIDQTVYTINDFLAKTKIKIGIPCKEYPQSYFVNFTPLARTWIGAKRNVG